MAKSFGLREAPGQGGSAVGNKKTYAGGGNDKNDCAEKVMKRKARALVGSGGDEFGDGNALKLSNLKRRRVNNDY